MSAPTSWRERERHLIAALRHEGVRVVDGVGGEPIAVIELLDDDTGQSLGVQRLFSVEKLARSLEWIE